jgi:hypothetical protein
MSFTESAWEVSQERLPGGPGYDPSPEEIPAVFQGPLNEWHNSDTGRIITAAEAQKLRGLHAEKCECQECEEGRNDEREWE